MLQVIPPALFHPEVGVQRSVSCCTDQLLSLDEWDVLTVPPVPPALPEPKVDEVKDVALFPSSHHEIGGLDVSVQEPVVMNKLYQ